MVNLYDNPAQAKFINTYVPIQFEHLYKLADKREADMEKAYAAMEKASSVEALGSLSDVDNKLYEQEYIAPIKSFIANNVKDISSLTNPKVRAQLSQLVHNATASSGAKNAFASKAMYGDYLKNLDPRWGQAGVEQIKTHNTFQNGIFTGKPLEYFDVDVMGQKVIKGMGSKLIKSATPGDWNDYYGQKQEDIRAFVDERGQEFANDPSAMLYAKQALSSGRASKEYYELDDQGNPVGLKPGAEIKFIQDNVYAAASKAATLEGKPNRRMEAMFDWSTQLALQKQRQAHERQMKKEDEAEAPQISILSSIKGMATDNFGQTLVSTAGERVEQLLKSGAPKDQLIGQVGSEIVLAAEKSIEKKSLEGKIKEQESNLNYLQASGDKSPETATKIAELSKSVTQSKAKLDEVEKQYSFAIRAAAPIVMNNVRGLNNSVERAGTQSARTITINGKSHPYLSTEDVEAASTNYVDPSVMNEYAGISLGGKTKATVKSTGSQRDMISVSSANQLSVVNPVSNSKTKFTETAIINRATDAINTALASGKFNGKVLAEASGKIRVTGGDVDAQYLMYIPKEELEAAIAATPGLSSGTTILALKNAGYISEETISTEKGLYGVVGDRKMYVVHANSKVQDNAITDKLTTSATKINK